MGTGASGAQKALTHIGAQKALQAGVSTKDARQIMRKLQSSGAITDERASADAFKRAERVANFASRMQREHVREERLQEYRAQRSLGDDIVARNAHGVSAIGQQQQAQHATSIVDAMKAKKTNGAGGAAPTSQRGGIVQLVKPIELPRAPLQDIPFD